MIDPEDALWPSYEDVTVVLYELSAGLFGSADDSYPTFNVANRELLESAIAIPHHPYYGSFESRLAAMVRSIAANHALIDGNKRLALAVLHSTLLVNDHMYIWGDEAAEVVITRCATGETNYDWLAEFIDAWSIDLQRATSLDSIAESLDYSDPDILLEIQVIVRNGGRNADGLAPGMRAVQDMALKHARGEMTDFEIELWRTSKESGFY